VTAWSLIDDQYCDALKRGVSTKRAPLTTVGIICRNMPLTWKSGMQVSVTSSERNRSCCAYESAVYIEPAAPSITPLGREVVPDV